MGAVGDRPAAYNLALNHIFWFPPALTPSEHNYVMKWNIAVGRRYWCWTLAPVFTNFSSCDHFLRCMLASTYARWSYKSRCSASCCRRASTAVLAGCDVTGISDSTNSGMLEPMPDDGCAYMYCAKKLVRQRHETVNKRLKNWACLKTTFRHEIGFHEDYFTAVVVMTQLEFNFGLRPFQVEY